MFQCEKRQHERKNSLEMEIERSGCSLYTGSNLNNAATLNIITLSENGNKIPQVIISRSSKYNPVVLT